MAYDYVDDCRWIPAAGGTGSFVYSSTVTGYQSPTGAGMVNGATYEYRAESADFSQWENGLGTWTSSTSTLARTTISASSNAGAVVNFTVAPQIGITIFSASLKSLLRVDQAQAFSTAQQLQGRSNLGTLWQPITVIDFSSATAAVDVVLPSGLKVIRLTGWIDSDASSGAPFMRVSADGGVTFAAGAADYQYSGFYNAAGTTTTAAPTNTSGMFVAGGDPQVNIPALFTTVLTLGDATRLPIFKSEWVVYNTPGILDGQFAGYRGANVTVNAIRILESGGNMAAGHVLIEGF